MNELPPSLADCALAHDIEMVIMFHVSPHVDYRLFEAARVDAGHAADNIIEMLKEKGILS